MMMINKEKAPVEQSAVKIFVKSSKMDNREGYCWAWKESMDKNIFGWCSTIEEVKRRAANMFPGYEIQVLTL